MTDHDIDNLSGRELDAAVAEHVMGWHYVRCGPRCWGIPPEDNQMTNRYTDVPYADVPYYSTDISAAWQVVERMRTTDHVFHLSSVDSFCDWLVTFSDEVRSVEAPTAPLAICRAALKAVHATTKAKA